jgi:4'-phosphopantetheinyl transferase
LALPVQLLLASQAVLLEGVKPAPTWLSPDEKQRWHSLTTENRRREFFASRLGIRQVLALSGWQSEGINLSANAGSVPKVITNNNILSVPFLSLSHSQHYVACACAPFPIGVDLEVLPSRRLRNVCELANFVCSPYERVILDAAPTYTEQAALFLKFWVLKESWFKLLGTGMDFQQIKKISCAVASEVPVGVRIVGHAYLWEARDIQSFQLLLALCTSHLLSVHDFGIDMRDGLSLTQEQPWCVFEMPDDV